jgi:hypothetical protein
MPSASTLRPLSVRQRAADDDGTDLSGHDAVGTIVTRMPQSSLRASIQAAGSSASMSLAG